MDNDRWNHVDQLLQSALDISAVERDAYLRNACDGDQRLEAEVRSLLAAYDRADRFLGAPAIDLAARELAGARSDDGSQADVDPLIGQTLSHYRIVEKLGGGGMGVVYKAEDSRLHRPVALKFVTEGLASDAEALSRFQGEARTASALNHPHICTVYDIGEQDGRSFIAMEYLEGATLKDRLAAGPLGLDTVLRLGIQIADALEAAHTAGVIHRDIKPANIFIGPRDRVKVLDFGLAEMRVAGTPQPEVTTIAGARQGVVTGTAAYMAPEQARGEAVDHRADIWSFGLVLYEMAKGTRPAPAVRLRVEESPGLESVISKCLETDRDLRYQHAADLRTDLERLKGASDSALTGHDQLPAKARVRWTVVAAAAAAIALAAVGYSLYPRQAKLTDKDSIVLAEFTNTTGDPVFDDTLRQGLAVQLQQSPFLSLISDDRIRRTLRLMNQPADARLTPDVARVVCVRTGGAAVLQGSIAALGSQYGPRAARNQLRDRGHPRRRAGTGVAERRCAEHTQPDSHALPNPSWRITRHCRETLDVAQGCDDAVARSAAGLQRRITKAGIAGSGTGRAAVSTCGRDRSRFCDGPCGMSGSSYSKMGESALARPSLLKAYQLRNRASDVERFYIDTLYDRDFTGNLERERRTLETWAESYPRDASAHTLIAGLALSSTGQHELAIAETEKAIALDPDVTPAYVNRAFNQLSLNRLDDALLTVRLAAERKLESASCV